jgi:hypothetical protein
MRQLRLTDASLAQSRTDAIPASTASVVVGKGMRDLQARFSSTSVALGTRAALRGWCAPRERQSGRKVEPRRGTKPMEGQGVWCRQRCYTLQTRQRSNASKVVAHHDRTFLRMREIMMRVASALRRRWMWLGTSLRWCIGCSGRIHLGGDSGSEACLRFRHFGGVGRVLTHPRVAVGTACRLLLRWLLVRCTSFHRPSERRLRRALGAHSWLARRVVWFAARLPPSGGRGDWPSGRTKRGNAHRLRCVVATSVVTSGSPRAARPRWNPASPSRCVALARYAMLHFGALARSSERVRGAQ